MKDNMKVTIYFGLFVLFLVLAFWAHNAISKNQLDDNMDESNITKVSGEEKIKALCSYLIVATGTVIG